MSVMGQAKQLFEYISHVLAITVYIPYSLSNLGRYSGYIIWPT